MVTKLKVKRIISREEVRMIANKYQITLGNFEIKETGRLIVYGDVIIKNSSLTKLPLFFSRVDGNFDISNLKLKNLKGCPTFVGGKFNCAGNILESLKFGPKVVRGSYDCRNNKLKSLAGCATYIGNDLQCANNILINMIGSPKKITGLFNCKLNKLTSLDGCPDEIWGRLNISNNLITNFKNAFSKKEFRFVGEMYCTSNFVNNLEGLPANFDGKLFLDRSTKSLNYSDFFSDKMSLELRLQHTSGFNFMPQILVQNHAHFSIILKYQSYYEIWDDDDILLSNNFNMLIEDILDGLK